MPVRLPAGWQAGRSDLFVRYRRPVVQPRSRAWLAIPLVAFALVSLTIGLVAHQRLGAGKPYFHLFFTDTIHMKVWLVTAAIVLALTQLLTASRIYGLLHFPPPG